MKAGVRQSLGSALLVTVASVVLWSAGADAGILVVAPHPDDEIITGAGVLQRAVGREEATVVYMTNGDYQGTAVGLSRQAEAVTAQTGFIGTTEDDLIFLGYPDGWLREIFDNFASPSSQFVTPSGQGLTYGNRGLGRTDFHSYRFGSAARYNLPNVVGDLAEVLRIYRPNHIYTTSEFDRHHDHSTTYRILLLALESIRQADTSYTPVVHKTIVWSADDTSWPAAVDPTSFHNEIPGLTQTPLRWEERASLDVPLAMQDLNLRVNPKYRAIQAHASQAGPRSFIGRFAHKDEVFWSENLFGSNQPPVAHAGYDIYSAPGSLVILNGSLSRDPEGAPLAYRWRQWSGPPVALASDDTAYPWFTLPADATANHGWTFELTVDDGTSESASDMVTVFGGTPMVNIAPLATVSASSENAGPGQQARKAVDRLVDGWPNDYTLEWATNNQRSGAWIRLVWAQPMVISGAQLFDRPNANDRVLGGVLAFSDGTSVSVGPLANDATVGTDVVFSPRVVTHATFTVTSVSASTESVGLAELRVFGSPASSSDTTAPSVPGSLSVTGTSASSISLTWSPSTDTGGSGLEGYRIYRNGGVTALASVTVPTFTDIGLTPDTSYSYRVTAYDAAGNESAAAGPVTGRTQAANVAPVVTNPGAQSGTVGTAITGLQIVASDGNSDPLTFSATGLPAGLAISTSGLITGTPTAAGTSSVTVTANDGRGGTGSATFSWTIAAANVAPVVTNPGSQSGTVGTAITGLQIVASDGNSDPLTFSATGLPAGLAISTSGLITGTPTAAGTSSVTVTANDGRGGTGSATFSWTIVDQTPPTVPTSLAVTGTTTTSISLSWSPSTDSGGAGLAGYRIYRDGSAVPLASVTGTTFTDNGLTNGMTYSYRVTAYDAAGNESAAAGSVSGTARDTQAPSVPQSLAASNITTTSVTISWQPSTDAGGSGLAGYRVFRDGVLRTTVTGTAFTDSGLTPGVQYRYAMAAYDGAGNQSALSSQIPVRTKKK